MDLQEQLVKSGMSSRGFMDDLPCDPTRDPRWIREQTLATRQVRTQAQREIDYALDMEDLLNVRSIRG